MSDPSDNPLSLLHRLKERKLVQWAVGYLAGGFVVLQLMDALEGPLGLSQAVQQGVLVLLLVGFPVTLVLAWYHGEQGRQRVSGPELVIISGLLVVSGFGFRILVSDDASSERQAGTQASLPLVVMMDSPHPAPVYDEETLAANGMNADAISDILLDLPIRRQRESIGSEWRRDEEILQFEPDLIVIHYSGFRQEDGTGSRERLKLFISYFEDSDAKFLIYSRSREAVLRERVDDLLADLESRGSDLPSRVDVFGLDDYGPRNWRSPLTSNQLKLRVKDILGV